MKIVRLEIPLGQIVRHFRDLSIQNGAVTAFDGKLNIRPAFQREYRYGEKQAEAVVHSVMNGYPINDIYFSVRENPGEGEPLFDLLDGQQRLIALCMFYSGNGSVTLGSGGDLRRYNWDSLDEEEREAFLQYKVSVQQCHGTEKERKAWFKILNIGNLQMTEQEIRNSIYAVGSAWLMEAKRFFSVKNPPSRGVSAHELSYFASRKDAEIAQYNLETALEWFAGHLGIVKTRDDPDVVDAVMRRCAGQGDASELIGYFTAMVGWIERVFPPPAYNLTDGFMRGVDWGRLYNQHGQRDFSVKALAKLNRRFDDVMRRVDKKELKNPKGVFEYLLTGDWRHMQHRGFEAGDMDAAYVAQGGKCKHCGEAFAIDEMEGDHVVPWALGGKTEPGNCQMLCVPCHRKKTKRDLEKIRASKE